MGGAVVALLDAGYGTVPVKCPCAMSGVHAAPGRTGTDRDLMGLIPELALN
jgi:hypothetical protein